MDPYDSWRLQHGKPATNREAWDAGSKHALLELIGWIHDRIYGSPDIDEKVAFGLFRAKNEAQIRADALEDLGAEREES